MNININFEHEYISKERVNEICMEYVNSVEENFEKYIEKYSSAREYLFLSNLGENIVSWYKFKSYGNVLEFSNDFGQVTNLLQSNNLNVTRYEKEPNKIALLKKRFKKNSKVNIKCIDDIKNDGTLYDYVVLFNVLDHENFKMCISQLCKKITKDGKIIIVYENQNSVSSMSCINSELEISKNLNNKKFLTNKELLSIFDSNGMKSSQIYAIFPNSYITSFVYNSKFIMNSKKEVAYDYYDLEKKLKIYNEYDMLNKLLKIDYSFINYFSNSYFIESSFNDDCQLYNMVSFNNYRNTNYSLITKINNEIVQKIPRFKEAREHIISMKNGIEYLTHNGIDVLDKYSLNDGIYSCYIKDKKTFDDEIYYEYLINNDLNQVANMYLDSYRNIRKLCKKFNSKNKNKILDKIPDHLLEKMNFLEVCPWDMVAKNCFYLSGKYVYFDQEWYESYFPFEFLIYRSVINSYKLVKIINVNDIFKILNMSEYIEYFKEIDSILFDKIANKNIYNLLFEKKEKMSIDQLLYLKNENIVLKEKIYDYEENDKKQDEYISYLENIKNEYFNFKGMRFKEQVKKLFKERTSKNERK